MAYVLKWGKQMISIGKLNGGEWEILLKIYIPHKINMLKKEKIPSHKRLKNKDIK